jgi:hypothetical protein
LRTRRLRCSYLKPRVDNQVSVGADAWIEAFGLAVSGNQGRVIRNIDGQNLPIHPDGLADLKMQVRRGAIWVAVHVSGDVPQNVTLLHRLPDLHGDRLRMHVQVPIVGPIGTLQANRGIRRYLRDNPVHHRDHFPSVVLTRGWSDILPLMARPARTHGHRPSANLTIRIALEHWVIVDRVTLAPAGFPLAVPAAAAVTPNLRVHVRMLVRRQPQGENDIRKVNLAIALAAAVCIMGIKITWRVIGESEVDGRFPCSLRGGRVGAGLRHRCGRLCRSDSTLLWHARRAGLRGPGICRGCGR